MERVGNFSPGLGLPRASNWEGTKKPCGNVQILDTTRHESYAMRISSSAILILAATTAWGQISPQAPVSATPVLSSAAVSRTLAVAESSISAAGVVTSDDPAFTIKKRVDEVHLLFTAIDKHGHFVKTLGQNDLTILDDHKSPQAVLNFRRETDLPLQVGLLVDVSGSVTSRFAFEQDSAIAFLHRTLRPGSDQAFVVGFNSRWQMMQDFTDNVVLLSQGVHRLRSGGGTALYDAIYRACKDKLMDSSSDHPVRRALIVLSDGDDNQSDISREAAIEMAQRAEVILYTISTDDSPSVQRGDHVLRQLADATGGRSFFPLKDKDVAHSFAAIQDELRSQYVVSYKPAQFDADGRYRTIEISALKKDLSIRARKGYFAPRR
jgi:VWFA-related protein